MLSKNIVIQSLDALKAFLNKNEIKILTRNASSIFVQIYTFETNPQWASSIVTALRETLPQAVFAGASTVGEIAYGELLTGSTIVSISFFEKTEVKAFIVEATGSESELGKNLRLQIENRCTKIDGVLLLATPMTMNVSNFLAGFSLSDITYPIFGGGAGDYASMKKSLLFCNDQYLNKGAVAVVFMGHQIKIKAYTYLGWQALSKKMTITEVDGLWVKKIDDQPAFDVYQRYLDIQNDENFFLNVLEFPFLIIRDGIQYARVPVAVNNENAINFIADVKPGESFRIGYGNPSYIIEKAKEIGNLMKEFNPEAIFLYSCGSRRFLLQGDVEQETRPFESIAPTFGFYTYGEFMGDAKGINLLNSTMVAVGMKEDDHSKEFRHIKKVYPEKLKKLDPYAYKHSRIISRLIYFIRAVTEELEEAHKEAMRLAEIDILTKAYNRVKAYEFLTNETNRGKRYKSKYSVIMMDIDFFKKVNDTYGHNAGDAVLVHLVKIVKEQLRSMDMLSRWGGEEFLILLPETGLDGAMATAERIRLAIEQASFPEVGNLTCSFGVTLFRVSDNIESLLERADEGLYEAKNSGRNRVVAK